MDYNMSFINKFISWINFGYFIVYFILSNSHDLHTFDYRNFDS